VLQDCVEEAAKHAETKTAIVSLVMKKTQVFRAAVGLPPELETTRATSRSASFCQFVVRTESTFVVSDARNDPRVPQELVNLGVVAYAGVPIRVNEQVLGALCVTDGVPRRFLPGQISGLRALAGRVSKRLEMLSVLDTGVDEMTVVPASQLAARAALLAQVVQRWLVEVGPMVRLARGVGEGAPLDGLRHAGRVLAQASEAYDEMSSAVAELCAATKRVEEAIGKAGARTG